MKTIWVTGSKGQLGKEIQLQQKKLRDARFLFTDIEELDLTDKDAVMKFAAKEKPAIIINCAAYTAVDKAEEEPEKATLLNKEVPDLLTDTAKEVHAILIQISTDYIFDGTACAPYVESDPPNPQSTYAESKHAGEEAVLKSPENLVIRTSWLYSAHGNNFLKTMLRLGKERNELGVVFDQVGSPTSAADLAGALLDISTQILDGKPGIGGIYHYSNEGVCSWYDFALLIMKTAKIDCQVKPITSDQFPTPAKRPQYSVLNKNKLKNTFSIKVPHWQESAFKVINHIITSG